MSRRNGSSSAAATRAADLAASSRLRMDRNPQHARITDPSLPAGRRKEIDNVMKRARAASPGSWDRKLLEVEEKDPNRWRHTGYKQLYIDGSISPSPPRGRSRSPVGRGGRSRSPVGRGGRSRSPIGRRSRSPIGRPVRSRSPVQRAQRSRSPRVARSRSPVPRRRTPPPLVSTTTSSRPRSPPAPVVSSSRGDARRGEAVTSSRRDSPQRGLVSSSRAARKRDKEARVRPPSPPPPRRAGRSPSGSSMSSCSDDSCSVCSAKNKRRPISRSRSVSPPAPARARPPPAAAACRPRAPLGKPLNSGNANAAPSSLAMRRAPPTRELLQAREGRKRSREEKVLEWQQSQLVHQQQRIKEAGKKVSAAPKAKEKPVEKLKMRIKKEGEKKSSGGGAPDAGVSAEAIAAALADSPSDDDSSSASDDTAHAPAPQRLTLSERFGKMAQWSADRSGALENMRITRRDAHSALSVSIEAREQDAAARDEPPQRYSHSPAPAGHFPEELLASAPGGLPSWDDVRVRYDYYKKRGYLRGLTLSDYVKWEEWWYKYQEWLKRERAYERWAAGGGGGGGGGHGRRRGRRAGRRGS